MFGKRMPVAVRRILFTSKRTASRSKSTGPGLGTAKSSGNPGTTYVYGLKAETWAWLMHRQPPNNLMHMVNQSSSFFGKLGFVVGIVLWRWDHAQGIEAAKTEKCVRWLNGAYGYCAQDSHAPALLVRRLERLRGILYPKLLEDWRTSAAGKEALLAGSVNPSYGDLWIAERNAYKRGKRDTSSDLMHEVWEVEEIRLKLKHIGLNIMEIHHANPERLEMLRSYLYVAPLTKSIRHGMIVELEALDKARARTHNEAWADFKSPIFSFLANPRLPDVDVKFDLAMHEYCKEGEDADHPLHWYQKPSDRVENLPDYML